MWKVDITKSVILDQALKMSSIQDLEGITIGSIAAELKMSKSRLFGKFLSKEFLQIEVLRSGFELFWRKVVYPAFKAKPGKHRI